MTKRGVKGKLEPNRSFVLEGMRRKKQKGCSLLSFSDGSKPSRAGLFHYEKYQTRSLHTGLVWRFMRVAASPAYKMRGLPR